MDEQSELARQYGIRSIPSLLFFQDGKVVQRLSGVVAKRTLAAELEGLLAAA